MKNKIYLRMVAIANLAIIATMIGVTIVSYGVFTSQIRRDLNVSATLLKDTHFFESINIDTDDIDLSADIDDLRVTWIEKDGTVIYDNNTDAKFLSNHSNRPEVIEAFEKGRGESVRQSDTMNKNTFYYATLLDNGTVLRVSTKAESIWAVASRTMWFLVAVIVSVLVLCMAISKMLARQFIVPIEDMAEHLEDSNFEAPYKELEPFTETIRKQHADILSASKARQDFTANVSHELKTPLTAISGYAELIESGMTSEEQTKHFCTEIRRNSDRLVTLINDTIRLSELDRQDDDMFEEVDLCDVASDCMEELEISGRGKDIEVEFSGEHCNVRGNSELLRELIENLAQNAIRYNNPGGRVWISVCCESRPKLVVMDNGIGIPAEDQERIFERFYRVDKSRSKERGGTGLGLAIVKHIVEIHNARIKLESEPGKGTTVEVIF